MQRFLSLIVFAVLALTASAQAQLPTPAYNCSAIINGHLVSFTIPGNCYSDGGLLGTMANQNANAVNITGGTITGVNLFSSTVQGATPASGGGTTNFLRADGTWASPGGSVSSVSNSDGTLTISPTTGAVVASLNLAHSNVWTGAPIVAAMSLPTLSAGQLGLGGLTSAPTLNAAGEGAGWVDSANGLSFIGQGNGLGTGYDVALYTHNGSIAAGVVSSVNEWNVPNALGIGNTSGGNTGDTFWNRSAVAGDLHAGFYNTSANSAARTVLYFGNNTSPTEASISLNGGANTTAANGANAINFVGAAGVWISPDGVTGHGLGVDSSGIVRIGSTLATSSLDMGATGLTNTSTSNNGALTIPTTGTNITRNVADANPALVVTQSNASSTGDILDLANSGGIVASFKQPGELVLPASTTANAGLNLGQGSPPTSPVNGDLWATSSGVYARIAGSTVGPFGTGGGSLELTDGTTDLTDVTKVTVSGMTVGGTSSAATLTPNTATVSQPGVVQPDGSTIIISGATISAPNSLPTLGLAEFAIGQPSGALWNPSDKTSGVTLTNGNATASGAAGSNGVRSTNSQNSGQFYFEFQDTTISGTVTAQGLADSTQSLTSEIGQSGTHSVAAIGQNLEINGSSIGAFAATSLTSGDVLCIAVDLTAKLIWVRKNNGNWNNSGTANPATSTGGYSISSLSSLTLFPTLTSSAGNAYSVTLATNSSSFSFTAPSGFSPWSSASPTAPAAKAIVGDGTVDSGGNLVVTKTNGTAFGTAATQNTGTSGATIPLLNGNLSFSGTDTFTNSITISALTASLPVCTNGSKLLSSTCTGLIPNTDLVNQAITIGGTSVALGGSTSSFPSPGVIGGTTPAAGTFTTLTANTSLTLAAITGSAQCLHVDTSGDVSGTGSDCGSGIPSGSTNAAVVYTSNTAIGAATKVTFGNAQINLGGSGTNGQVKINDTSGLGTVTLTTASGTGNDTATLPFNTGTIAELNLAQTYTALQTFGTLTTTSTTTFSGLTTGTNADFLCLSSGGVVLLQSTACTISSLRFKKDVRPTDERKALDEILSVHPIDFEMKSGDRPNADPNYATRQTGLSAESVARTMPECAVYENDMKTPKSWRQECVIAKLVGAMQEIKHTNDNSLWHRFGVAMGFEQ